MQYFFLLLFYCLTNTSVQTLCQCMITINRAFISVQAAEKLGRINMSRLKPISLVLFSLILTRSEIFFFNAMTPFRDIEISLQRYFVDTFFTSSRCYGPPYISFPALTLSLAFNTKKNFLHIV